MQVLVRIGCAAYLAIAEKLSFVQGPQEETQDGDVVCSGVSLGLAEGVSNGEKSPIRLSRATHLANFRNPIRAKHQQKPLWALGSQEWHVES